MCNFVILFEYTKILFQSALEIAKTYDFVANWRRSVARFRLAVLFAGFGGVSMVMNTLEDPIQRIRLRNVIFTAVLLILMSMLPLVLFAIGVDEMLVWRIGVGLFLAFYIVFYVLSGDLQIFREATGLDRFLMSGDLVLLLELIPATFALFGFDAATVFLVAMFWNLFNASAMFLKVFAPVWED